MPRGRDECWQEVTRNLAEDSGKRHPRVTCKHCMTGWTSNEKARVIEHLQRCAELAEPLWRTYQPHRLDPTLPSAQELAQQQRARTRVAAPVPVSGGGGPVTAPGGGGGGSGGGSSSSSHAPAITFLEQDMATAACAQWISAAGLNPTVIEHPAFKSFVRTLRPSYKPPTRYHLVHALVDAPLMFVAYLADPQQERQHRRAGLMLLESNEEAQARSLQTFLLKYCDNNAQKAAALLGMLSLLRIKQGPFSNNMVWMAREQMSPMLWWQNFWLEPQPDLAELCILALAISPANDVIERDWNPQHFLQNMKRNSLSPEVINKLMPVFWNLRIKHGWTDDGPQASGDPADQDAEYTPDIDGFMAMQG